MLIWWFSISIIVTRWLYNLLTSLLEKIVKELVSIGDKTTESFQFHYYLFSFIAHMCNTREHFSNYLQNLLSKEQYCCNYFLALKRGVYWLVNADNDGSKSAIRFLCSFIQVSFLFIFLDKWDSTMKCGVSTPFSKRIYCVY